MYLARRFTVSVFYHLPLAFSYCFFPFKRIDYEFLNETFRKMYIRDYTRFESKEQSIIFY